ncbi:MAG: PAS domain S-box protein [Deltaproteobacteria bacterium]|nr:PAS domain S-box protein [Deltaproteobacteria bacterium]
MLIVSRVSLLSLMLLMTFFLVTVSQWISVSRELLRIVYAVFIVMFLLSIVYTLLLKKEKYFWGNIYLQLIADIALVSFLVYLTGSISSNYSLIYTLIIIYSAIFLGRQGALITASVSGVAYAVLLILEYTGVVPFEYAVGHNNAAQPSDILMRISVNILSFYIVAFLASFVVEQEKKTRSLLEERESAFDQLDRLFRSIVESLDTGVLTTTLHGRIKTFNRAAEMITGATFRAIENRHVLEIFPEFHVFFDSYPVDVIRNRREVKISGGAGRSVPLGCAISSLRDGRGEQIGYILIFQDLTEIKRMEDDLEKSRRLALIGEMAAGLAHEMRNPLASITGSIQLLAATTRIQETDKRLMQIILRGKDQLDNFVRGFLMLARPVPEVREPVNVGEVVREVLEQIKASSEWADHIRLVTRFSEASPVLANKEQVRQVIQNLLLNAVQAMEKEGRLCLEISPVILEDGHPYTALTIEDEGCGIEEKDLRNVFEPFFTQKEKGTGLGLAVVSRIVDGYGGRIKLESRISQGTTVTVWLPCGPVASRTEGAT